MLFHYKIAKTNTSVLSNGEELNINEYLENFHTDVDQFQFIDDTELNGQWLQLALDAAQMCAYRRDLKTNIVVRSHRPLNDTTYSSEQSSWDYAEGIKRVHPEDRVFVNTQLNKAVKNNQKFSFEFRTLRPKGEIRWLQVSGQPIHNDNKETIEVLSVIQDVTERKSIEASLKSKSEELAKAKGELSLALEAAGMAAITRNNNYEPFYSSELKKLLGLEESSDAVSFETFMSCLHPDDRAQLKEKMDVPRIHNHQIEDEIRVILPDRKIRYLSVRGRHLLDPATNEILTHVVFHDITKQKENEEILKVKNAEILSVNEKLEQFSSIVAHDLKSPLNTITMAADLLKDLTSVGEVTQSAQLIQRNALRMSNLITDLLQFAKTSNQTDIPKEPVDLRSIFETVQSNLQGAINKSDAQIEIRGQLPIVYGHRMQLLQLFQNLISNGLKFNSSKAPQITITSSAFNDSVDDQHLISIKDNGVGMDVANADRLFEPFQRFHAKSFEGTGLGLSICKKIIDLHGGKIWVQSSPGLGSEFFFTLPKINIAKPIL